MPTIGTYQAMLRQAAPQIAELSEGYWDDAVIARLVSLERRFNERLNSEVFDELYYYGINEVSKATGRQHNRGRRRNPSAVVSEIHRQLAAQGIGPRYQFVEWAANTLKVSRGTDGVLIHYNRGMDLYDIDEYHGFDVRPFRENVYAEDLLQVIEPALHRTRFGNRGRRRF